MKLRMLDTPGALLLFRQFSRFFVIGGTATIIHYAVLTALTMKLGVPPVAASAVGFVCGAVFSYFFNHRITFASSMGHAVALPRFFAVGVVGLGINCALVALLSGPLDLHWMIAQLFASAVVLCWNFAANRSWTFTQVSR